MNNPQPPIHVDHLFRTNRRTVALVVTREGKLIVRAPLRMSWKTIETFIEQKRAWIMEKQAQARAYTYQAIPHSFTEGESFLYLGHAYPLMISERARPVLALEPARKGSPAVITPLPPLPAGTDRGAASNGKLLLPADAPSQYHLPPSKTDHPLAFILSRSAQPAAREIFVRWYRAQALAILRERITYWSAQTGLVPTGLRVTSARTRWGSCSAGGMLNFPWRLVMAPLSAVDYVVVHELVHLQEKNHARSFWQCVARILPDYHHQMAWLKENGHLLII